jgi:hypothetical protein
MPKLVCPCGFVHNLSPIPDEGWITVRDVDYEALVASEREEHGSGQRAPSLFVRLAGLLYTCPECGRLMWKKPGESEYRIFSPEI